MSEFKVGDVVRVVKRVEKENGWDNQWIPEMDEFIGGEFVVENENFRGISLLDDGNGLWFRFPPSSLELVKAKEIVFEVGDVVRVVTCVEEEAGWQNDWVPEMDEFIGGEFVVNNNDVYGIELYMYELDAYYGFPPSSLELVEKGVS